MAKGFINDSTLTAIANAIRAKNGETAKMKPSAMAAAIEGINGFAWGTITSNSSTATARPVSHGLGSAPKAIVIAAMPPNTNTLTNSMTGFAYHSVYLSSSQTGYYSYYNSGTMYCYELTTFEMGNLWASGTTGQRNYYPSKINATTFLMPGMLLSGMTYLWMAFRGELV